MKADDIPFTYSRKSRPFSLIAKCEARNLPSRLGSAWQTRSGHSSQLELVVVVPSTELGIYKRQHSGQQGMRLVYRVLNSTFSGTDLGRYLKSGDSAIETGRMDITTPRLKPPEIWERTLGLQICTYTAT